MSFILRDPEAFVEKAYKPSSASPWLLYVARQNKSAAIAFAASVNLLTRLIISFAEIFVALSVCQHKEQ